MGPAKGSDAVEEAAATQRDISKRVVWASGGIGLVGVWLVDAPVPFLTGLALGTAVSLLNFRLLYLTLCQAVQMRPARAQRYTTGRYLIRYILMTLLLVGAFHTPRVSAFAAFIGLLLIKLVILQRDLFNSKAYFKRIFGRKEEK